MMPLVTWGLSGIKIQDTAYGTAILTSLRTIAGAIGSSVFVAIMTIVAEHSVENFGINAQIHGLNVTFLVMSCITVILLCIPIFCIKKSEIKEEM